MENKKLNPQEQFERSRKRVYDAQDDLLTKLFGSVPENPAEFEVTREEYIKAMDEVKAEHGLQEGDPDLVLFVLEQLSRSPRIKEEANG